MKCPFLAVTIHWLYPDLTHTLCAAVSGQNVWHPVPPSDQGGYQEEWYQIHHGPHHPHLADHPGSED